jgi:hypothetical protein
MEELVMWDGMANTQYIKTPNSGGSPPNSDDRKCCSNSYFTTEVINGRDMKTIFILVLVFLTQSVSAKEYTRFEAYSSLASSSTWKTVEKVSFDWVGDKNPYVFLLKAPSGYNDGGNYLQLQIMREGKVLITINGDEGFAKLDDALAPENSLKKRNILESEHLLMIPSLKGRSKYPLLLLFGWAYGSSPGSIHVVALGDDQVPKEILNLKTFGINSFADLDKDNIPEIIGQPCFSQSWGTNNSFLTYDPFHVYRFGAEATSAMKLDLQLTEIYNKKNYYGWAGAKCSEDIAVVLHPPAGGKPVVMDADKARGLFEK